MEITPEFTTVEIISESACGSCRAKGLCGLGDAESKAVQLPTDAWAGYKVGEEVEVLLKAGMGHKAVWLAYVIPLALLMAGIFVFAACGLSEPAAGAAAICTVGVYYFVIWCLRSRLRSEYVFEIKR